MKMLQKLEMKMFFNLSDLLKNSGKATYWDLSTDIRQLQIFFIGTSELEKLQKKIGLAINLGKFLMSRIIYHC